MTIESDEQSQDLLALLLGLANLIQPKPIVWREYKPLVAVITSPGAMDSIESRMDDALLDFNTDSSLAFTRLISLIEYKKNNLPFMSLCFQLHKTYIPADLMNKLNPAFKARLENLLTKYTAKDS